MYCYTEFKLHYLNNLKLFSVGIKEVIEPIVLWGEKADGFLLFLKALSSETNLLVTLGDFTVKKRKIWKGNLYFALMLITFSSPRAQPKVVYFFDIKWKPIFFLLQMQNFSFKFFLVLEI